MKVLFVCIALVGFVGFSIGQEITTSKEEGNLLNVAEINYENQNMTDALLQFERLFNYDKANQYYKAMFGICLLSSTERRQESTAILEQVLISNPENNILKFYLGKSFALNGDFDKARDTFQDFISNSKSFDQEEVDMAIRFLNNCDNAQKFISNKLDYKITNLGMPLNSDYSEYAPVISYNEKEIIFTYRGDLSTMKEKKNRDNGAIDFTEDVFYSTHNGSTWSVPKSIGENINTVNHDAAIAISMDGETLFLYKSEKNQTGDIYVSEKKDGEWAKPERLKGTVNMPKSWEGSCSLSPDEETLIFSSDREGGHGGRDLYVAKKQEDGSWGEVENLGRNINTDHNEDAPFLFFDNQTLYFSSEGHNSMGGYDIFYSHKQNDGSWGEPVNLGYPINTVEDNRYFVLSVNNSIAYFSTDGVNSLGGHDIFKIQSDTRNFGNKEIALFTGKIFNDDAPVSSIVEVRSLKKNKVVGVYTNNEQKGSYVFALPLGDTYDVNVKMANGVSLNESFNTTPYKKYTHVNKDFHFLSQKMISSGVVKLDGKIVEEGSRVKIISSTNPQFVKQSQVDENGLYMALLPPEDTYFVEITLEDGTVLRDTLNWSDTKAQDRKVQDLMFYTPKPSDQLAQNEELKSPTGGDIDQNPGASDNVIDNQVNTGISNPVETNTTTPTTNTGVDNVIATTPTTKPIKEVTSVDIASTMLAGQVLKGAFGMSNAKVRISDGKNIVEELTTNSSGNFSSKLKKGKKYYFDVELTSGEKAKDSLVVSRDASFATPKIINIVNVDDLFAGDIKGNNQSSNSTTGAKDNKPVFDVANIEEGDVLNLKNVYFAFDSYELLTDAVKELKHVETIMKENPNMELLVYGFTDNTGESAYNVWLSEQRVKAVTEYLVNKGIDRTKLKGKEFGAANPAADNNTIESRRLNRRVEFKVIKLK